jgi:hypothetical protein
MNRTLSALASSLLASVTLAAPLELVAKVALPGSKGRIDHVAYDAKHERLFVAELGTGAVAVIDIAARRLERRIPGLRSPQAVAYLSGSDRLLVTTDGDGTLRAYDGTTFALVSTLELGAHADNLRIDAASGLVYVGFGDGALAVLDARTLDWQAQIPLEGHPESFQVSADAHRVYVNVPSAGEIAVVDLVSRRQVARWPTGTLHSNYPMVLDVEHGAALVVFREPAKIARFRIATGEIATSTDSCGDADDIFVDARRGRVYLLCGAGMVDVLRLDTLERMARFATAPGARTGTFSPEADRLFVAARAAAGGEATIWILKPGD